MFSGWKTYIVAGVTIVWALVSYWQGTMTFDAATALVLGGAGLGALRHGVSTGGKL